MCIHTYIFTHARDRYEWQWTTTPPPPLNHNPLSGLKSTKRFKWILGPNILPCTQRIRPSRWPEVSLSACLPACVSLGVPLCLPVCSITQLSCSTQTAESKHRYIIVFIVHTKTFCWLFHLKYACVINTQKQETDNRTRTGRQQDKDTQTDNWQKRNRQDKRITDTWCQKARLTRHQYDLTFSHRVITWRESSRKSRRGRVVESCILIVYQQPGRAE